MTQKLTEEQHKMKYKGFELDPRMLCVRCSRYIPSERHKEEESPNNNLLDMSGLVQNGVVLEARKAMTKAFKADPDFRRAYVDNIACILMDNHLARPALPTTGFMYLESDKPTRDQIASDILKHILETE